MVCKPARDLIMGDVFRMHIHGEVVAATPVAGGKRIKIKIALENQGHRPNGGSFAEGNSTLEFTDAGYVLEFLCRPGRKFHIYEEDDWDDDDDGDTDAPDGGDDSGVDIPARLIGVE